MYATHFCVLPRRSGWLMLRTSFGDGGRFRAEDFEGNKYRHGRVVATAPKEPKPPLSPQLCEVENEEKYYLQKPKNEKERKQNLKHLTMVREKKCGEM